MKIVQVFNRYRTKYGGEVAVVERTAQLLSANGHKVIMIERSSDSIRSVPQKIAAFGSSVYSFSESRKFARMLRLSKPDIVHVHNLYPLFSPSILVAARRTGVPVVMTVHNQLLSCAVGTNYCHDRICNQCKTGSALSCVANNCAESLTKSVNYALRFSVARRLRLFMDNVSCFIVQDRDALLELESVGVSADRIAVLPNGVRISKVTVDPRGGTVCLFVGRLIHQKGVGTLVAAAKAVPDIPVVIAGDGPERESLLKEAPDNVRFFGRADKPQIEELYRSARVVVFPSQGYESFGLVVIEALSYGIPVLASRIRGPRSIIDDAATGVFFEPGSASDLSDKLRRLWDQPESCYAIGQAGRRMVAERYNENAYYNGLIRIYGDLRRQRSVCNS